MVFCRNVKLLLIWVFWYNQVGKDGFLIFWIEKHDFRAERLRSEELHKIDPFLEG